MKAFDLKRWRLSILAFLVPAATLAAAYALYKVEPFGPNSILFGDMAGQYVNFMADFKELFGRGLFYTWHKALGGEALSLAAYYLFSPFNLLLLLFPTQKLSLAMVCLTLLKTGAAGSAMALFLRSRGGRSGMALAFGSAWALSGYMLGFAQNIMWLDGVILLPLVVWGLRRILEGKAPWLYLFSLSGAVFCCYYIGWMLCVFCGLYFLFHWLAGGAPHRLKALGRFAAASVLACGLQLWLLAPVGLALGQGKARPALDFSFAANFSLAKLPRQLLAGAYLPGEASNQLPLIFCGTLPLLLLPVFFASRRMQKGEKTAGAALLAVLLTSFYWRAPDLVWHGLQSPSWFPYRYSFLFIFVVLELAALGWQALAQTPRRWHPPAAVVLCTALAAELFVNSLAALNCFGPAPSTLPATVSRWQVPPANAAESADFYRVQYPDAPNQNTSFLLNYAGTAHYSSSYSAAVYDLYGALGLSRTSGWSADSPGVTTAAASLLAVRWQLTESQPVKNPLALPIGIAAAQISTARMATDLPFANLEALYSGLLGSEAGVLSPADFIGPDLEGLSGSGHLYTVDDPAMGGSLCFKVTAPAPGTLYASFPVYTQYCGAKVYVNGTFAGETLTQKQNGTVALGPVEAGQTLTVELRSQSAQLELAGWSFAVQQPQALAAACAQLTRGGLVLQRWGPGLLEGGITAPENTAALFTSIPYDKGWRVWVDGRPVQPYAALNSLLAAPLTPGVHTIKLAFIPYGLWPGLAASLAAAACLALWAALRRQRPGQ